MVQWWVVEGGEPEPRPTVPLCQVVLPWKGNRLTCLATMHWQRQGDQKGLAVVRGHEVGIVGWIWRAAQPVRGLRVLIGRVDGVI